MNNYPYFKLSIIVAALLSMLISCSELMNGDPKTNIPNIRGESVTDYDNSMPGSWRPFSPFSPWNTPLIEDGTGVPERRSTIIHPDSDIIMAYMTRTTRTRFPSSYLPAFWHVYNFEQFEHHFYFSDKIFDPWDCCPRDSISDIPLPIVREMYDEPTSDGHITIYDELYNRFFECSRFDWPDPGNPEGTTFNIWFNAETGVGIPDRSQRWQLQGGRGSGVPIIAGMLRPEEILSGEIHHKLIFCFEDCRLADDGRDIFINPPACRSDGETQGNNIPIQGMLFQLNPELTDADFDSWGMNEYGKIVARCLQNYGMYLVDRGGDWAIYCQLLGPDSATNRAEWDARCPGLYTSMTKIHTDEFRVIYTGEPTIFP